MAKPRQPARGVEHKKAGAGGHVYTLDVVLLSGPTTEAFTQANPVVSRTIQLRGDQTLEDLHHAIFTAFDREDQHLYEFQLGKGPMDPAARRYLLPQVGEVGQDKERPVAGSVDQTTLDALGLKVGDRFGYWFDFGDDWWHQINVEAIEPGSPRGKYPKVTKRTGPSPPQYADPDEDPPQEDDPAGMSRTAAADAACLVGEMHLGKGEFERAVEAFTRAIDSHPTIDAYQGRAKAYRGLADDDEDRAEKLDK